MNAETDAQYDYYHAVDLADVHPDVWAQAKEYRIKGYAARRARNSKVVSVSECARVLDVSNNRITTLVRNNHVWHEKRMMWFQNLGYSRSSRVVRVREVCEKLAEIDAETAARKANGKQTKKNKPLPPDWMTLVNFAALTAARCTTLCEWCKRGKIKADKFVIQHQHNHASLEWCVPLDESIVRLREIIAASRSGAHGGAVIKPDPRVRKTPLIEDIWHT